MVGWRWYGTIGLSVAAGVSACTDGEIESNGAPADEPLPHNPLDQRPPALEHAARVRLDDACVAGEYVAIADETGERGCAACEPGTYSTRANAASCQPWSVCPAGQYVESEPSRTADRVCRDCAAGTHTTRDNSPECAPNGECAPGTYAVEALSTEGIVCDECPTGTFNDGTSPGACETPSACAAGFWVAEEFESTHDRRCEACAAGTYSDELNATSCTVCRAGSYCPTGSSEPELCGHDTWDDDGDPATECPHWTTCDRGFGEVASGTAVSDRTCSPGQWFHRLGQQGGEGPGRVVVDATGDVYVAADTLGDTDGHGSRGDHDIFVRKLSGATGVEMWRVQFGSAVADSVSDIALDPAGALVIAGTEHALGWSSDFLRKLSTADGALMWTTQYDTSNGVRVVDTSANGDIAVAGPVSGGATVVTRMNAAGETLWEMPLEEPDGRAAGVAFDSTGNVAVGYSSSALSPGDEYHHHEAYVSVLSGDSGELLWTSRVDFNWTNTVSRVRSDGADRLLALVHAEDYEYGEDADHIVLIDSRDGTIVWSRKYDEISLTEACFDADGNILAALPGAPGAVQRLSRQDGAELSLTSINAEYWLSDLASTPFGDVVFAGRTSPSVVFTALLDGSAEFEHWRNNFGTTRDDELNSAAFDDAGDVIVGGRTATTFERAAPNLETDALVRKLSGRTGEPLWTRQFGTDERDEVFAVRADALGNVVVGGALAMKYDENVEDPWKGFVSKLSGVDGSTLWSTEFSGAPFEKVEAIALDSLGDAIVTGYTRHPNSSAGGFGAFAQKLSGVDGSLLWETLLLDEGRRARTIGSVGVMPNGDAIASWQGTLQHSGVLRLAAGDGSIVWEVLFDSSAIGNFTGELAVDAAGDVAVFGRADTVVKLSGADGSELWSASAGERGGIAFDVEGNLVMGNGDILRRSGTDGSWLGWAGFHVDGFSSNSLAVSASGDVVLAGGIYDIDMDGFVVKLLR